MERERYGENRIEREKKKREKKSQQLPKMGEELLS
jgi:hypothetical protein